MFNSFKKKPAIAMNNIDKVLADVKLFGLPLNEFITDKELCETVLNLYVALDTSYDQSELQNLYDELKTHLYVIGVTELNLNIAVKSQKPSKIRTHLQESKPVKAATRQSELAPHPRIRHIIAIASGKGGVGKSTTAVNVALALQALGAKVGILDADIYGPSMPDMLGVAGVKPCVENEQFVPIDVDGIAMLSIGNLIDTDSTPVAWRGIKATGALMQLYAQTNWPNLDYLIIDMPPGTGDIALTLAQKIPMTGAIVVTTPQHIALLDATKGMELFLKTGIPIIGVIENMATHTCSNCGHTEAIFGTDGGDTLALQYQVPLLGRLPLALGIRQGMDNGAASVKIQDDFAMLYMNIAQKIMANIGQFDKGASGRIF